MPLIKFLRFIVLGCGFCLTATVLIPRDPSNAILLGFSRTRLVMITGFVAAFIVLVAIYILLSKNTALQTRSNLLLNGWLAQYCKREVVQFAAALLLFIGLYFLTEMVLTTDQYQKQIMLRLAPAIIFMIIFCSGVLGLEYFRADRRKWATVISFSAVCTLGGILLQDILVGQITRYHATDVQLVRISRYLLSTICFLYIYRLTRLTRESRRVWVLVIIYSAFLCILQWTTLPSKYWRVQYPVALLAPVVIFAAPLTIRLLMDGLSSFHLDRLHVRKGYLLAAGILALLALIFPYYQAAREHSRTLNYAPIFTDQGEYLAFAKNARLLNFSYTGDHNRMPGYPFLQGLFYRSGMSDEAFFEQGKQLNIWLSILLLSYMAWIFRRYLPGFEAFLLVLIIAFSLYLFKAPYFQAEILFYFLAFVGYLLMQRMLLRPGIWLAAGTGVVLGLAHLTKSSVIVGLVIFAGVYIIKELVAVISQLNQQPRNYPPLKELSRRLGLLLLVFLCFIVVIFPYIRAMKIRFGHYFYNVNTTFYVWYDDNFDAIAAEEKYHFAEQWPSKLSKDEIPSLRNYLRQHSLAQIEERIRFGVQAQADNILFQFSVTNYHLTYLVFLVLVILVDLKNSLSLVKKYPFTVLFSILYFVGYLAAFVWYSPISPERRFTYGLYIPLMFSIFVAIDELRRKQQRGGWMNLGEFTRASNLIMTLTLIVNIPLVLTERMFFDRYGS